MERIPQLFPLVSTAWEHHAAADANGWAARPSAPILFFGALDAYLARSVPRVITVALNPSKLEFPSAWPFQRFPLCEDRPDPPTYLRSLGQYFRERPYWSWFNAYEQALQGLGSSYLDGALHTDVASCVPTDPTWGKLPPDSKSALAAEGVPLWHRLVTVLQPDIMLWSVARSWLDEIAFVPIGSWSVLDRVAVTKDGAARKQPLLILARWHLVGGRPSLAVHAPAANTPLGRFSHSQKRDLGSLIHSAWRRGVR